MEFSLNLGLRPQTDTRPKVAQTGVTTPDVLCRRYRMFGDDSEHGTRSIGKVSSLPFQRIKERLKPTPYEGVMPVLLKGALLKPRRNQESKWSPN